MTLQLFADAGPNTAGNNGAGASQAARLKDGDDATGIRFAATMADSRFSINPLDLPSGISEITQVTMNVRESRSFTQEHISQYNVYVGAALVGSVGVFLTFAPTENNSYPIFSAGETISAANAPNLIVGFTGGAYSGDRWDIQECYLTLDYNESNIPYREALGIGGAGIAKGIGSDGVAMGYATTGSAVGS